MDARALHGRLEATGVPRRAALAFGADPASLARASLGANAIYRGERVEGGGAAYLRIVHEGVRSRRELDATAAYLAHLHGEGAPVNAPLPARSGAWVETFPEEGGPWHARAVAAVPGRAVGAGLAPHAVYRAWGRALGRLHAAAACFEPADREAYYSVEREWRGIERALPLVDETVRAEAAALGAWLAGRPRDEPASFGLTHGDQNPGNALWDGERIVLIDFDEPMWSWWAADVARPFRELDGVPPAELGAAVRALVAGYREVRVLPDREVEALPGLLRLKQLEMYCWMLGQDARPLDGRPRAEVLAELGERVRHPLAWP